MPKPVSEKKYKLGEPKEILIQMDDGVELAADLYGPDKKGAYPTRIGYEPYRKDDLMKSMYFEEATYFAERGYNTIAMDIRGTGASGGTTDRMLREREWKDGYDAINWIADQEWCDGNTGIAGVSYGGFASNMVSTLNPPSLKCSIPIYIGYDFYLNNYPGGILEVPMRIALYPNNMLTWNGAPPRIDKEGRWERIWKEHMDGNEHWAIPTLTNQLNEKIWTESSVRHHIKKIKVPTYIIGGWRDVFVTDPFDIYTGLNPDTPKKLLVGPWQHTPPHVGNPGPKIDHLYESLRWMDYWMKDIDTGIMDEPPVTIFVGKYDKPEYMQKKVEGYWRNENEWPLERTTPTILYLDSENTFTVNNYQEHGYDTVVYDPTVGMTSMGVINGIGFDEGLPIDQRPDEAKSVIYTSEYFDKPVEITGIPTLELHVSSSTRIAMFVAKLSDVASDGTSALISKGQLNLTRRDSFTNPEPAVPGKIYKINFDLSALSYVLNKGHRLRLSISNANFPFLWPSPKNSINKIYRGRGSQSKITLPIVSPQEKRLNEPKFITPPETEHTTQGVFAKSKPVEWKVINDIADTSISTLIKGGEKYKFTDKTMNRTWQMISETSIENPAYTNVKAKARLSIDNEIGNYIVKTSTNIKSNSNTFIFTSFLKVLFNGKVVKRKKWTKRFPRNLL